VSSFGVQAVTRRRFPADGSPARQLLQPETTRAVMEMAGRPASGNDAMGHSRRFGRTSTISGLPQIADITNAGARRTYRSWWIGSPGARSSGARGFASPVVPGGASLLTLWVSTRSNVATDAIRIAMVIATANRINFVRC
jgi:hypothetical protein